MTMDRRSAIGTLTAASLGVLFDTSLFDGARARPNGTTVVLVHGAWADGSNWQNVILPLERHGFNVLSAQIALTSLSDDITTVQHALARVSGPVILVGHAYSGAVIGSIHDDRVKSLVFIAALAPAQGETVAQVFYKDPKPSQSPKLAPDAYGFIWMPDEGVKNALAQNATTDEARTMLAVQRPIAVKCIQEPAPATAWPAKPCWYLVAEEDRMINPQTERFMAERMHATIRSARVDHSPQVTAPTLVVDLIREAS